MTVEEKINLPLDPKYYSEVIAMAWCDKTSFEDIQNVFGLSEKNVIILMRQQLKPSSFRLWRKRVNGRLAKHRKKQNKEA